MIFTKEEMLALYSDVHTSRQNNSGFSYVKLTDKEKDFLKLLLQKEIEQPNNNNNNNNNIDEYNIKFQELSLTGKVPTHPRYLYEYYLPNDFGNFKMQIPFDDKTEEKSLDCEIYLNNEGKLVLASNYTPLVIGYKPRRDSIK